MGRILVQQVSVAATMPLLPPSMVMATLSSPLVFFRIGNPVFSVALSSS
jgi:hypothetical protein